jgi:hypothetical protein
MIWHDFMKGALRQLVIDAMPQLTADANPDLRVWVDTGRHAEESVATRAPLALMLSDAICRPCPTHANPDCADDTGTAEHVA